MVHIYAGRAVNMRKNGGWGRTGKRGEPGRAAAAYAKYFARFDKRGETLYNTIRRLSVSVHKKRGQPLTAVV